MTYMDYNNSSRQFRPWGSRVMALSIKCDYLALHTNWVTKDFLQTHGRAIGTKTAVSSKIETAIIDQHNTKPLLWKRYIDDVFSLWDTNREDQGYGLLRGLKIIYSQYTIIIIYKVFTVDSFLVRVTEEDSAPKIATTAC